MHYITLGTTHNIGIMMLKNIIGPSSQSTHRFHGGQVLLPHDGILLWSAEVRQRHGVLVFLVYLHQTPACRESSIITLRTPTIILPRRMPIQQKIDLLNRIILLIDKYMHRPLNYISNADYKTHRYTHMYN